MSLARSLVLAWLALILPTSLHAQTVPGCEGCPGAGAFSAPITGAQAQVDRLVRDGNASTCSGEAFPGTSGGGASFFYETQNFFRNFDAVDTCITVALDPSAGASPCGPNVFVAAYAGRYDSANPSVGYLGDVGTSVAQSFSFTVPAMTTTVWSS